MFDDPMFDPYAFHKAPDATQEAVTLKPCPSCTHCGDVKTNGFGNYIVQCSNCKVSGPFSDSIQEAEDGWNRRSSSKEEGCVFCGAKALDPDGDCNECGAVN